MALRACVLRTLSWSRSGSTRSSTNWMFLRARLTLDWCSTPAQSDRYEYGILLSPNNQLPSPPYKRHVSIFLLKEFPLGQYNNKKDLKDAVKKMAYMERGTMTGQALRYLTDNSFSAGQGARPGVTKVGIVFTDGRSQDYIGDAAKKAKEHGKRERIHYFLMHGCSIIRYNTNPTFTSHMRETCVCLCYRFQDVRCWSGQRSGG